MADLYTHAFSDNTRLAKSKSMIGLADATYNIIAIPRFALVKTVWIWKRVVSGAGASITIGCIGNSEVADPDAFMTNAETLPNALYVECMTGFGSTADWAGGKYFDAASGAITLTAATIDAAGSFIVFADYAVVC